MKHKQIVVAVLKKVMADLAILLLILGLVIAVTGIPMDFGVSYHDGETFISLTVDDAIQSIKNQFRVVLTGEVFSTEIKSESVMDILMTSLGRSAFVMVVGIVFAVVIGVAKGIIDSRKTRKAGTIKLLQSLMPLSLPDILIIALVQLGALYLFKNDISFLGLGIIPFIGDETLLQAIYPIISISVLPAAVISRTVAVVIEDGLSKPYILAARGKGCSLYQIIKTHLSKSIAFGVISVLPAVMGIMFSSLVIVEMFFYYRGIGYHLMYFYTTTLVPRYEAGLAFTVFIIALSVIYYLIFTLLNVAKLMILPRMKTY